MCVAHNPTPSVGEKEDWDGVVGMAWLGLILFIACPNIQRQGDKTLNSE
jgi:hypothetical protein